MLPLFFTTSPLFPSSPEETQVNQIRALGAPGEMVSLSFFVSCGEAIDELEIGILELRGASQSIGGERVDVHVVKVWQQAGIGIFLSEMVEVAELLVKDDRVSFPDYYSRRCCHWKNPRHWRHLLRPPKFYCPPSVRLHGVVCTDLKPYQKKQIWLTVKIPQEARAGIYEGYVDFVAKEGDGSPQQLRVQLEVLPIELVQPSQDFFIWYKGTLDCLLSQHHVSEATFEAQLRDIYEHGFTSFSLSESKTHLLQKAVDIAHRIGFRRNVVLMSPWPESVEGVDFKGLTPVYYLSDEADMRGQNFIQAHHDNWREVKEREGLTMSSVLYETKTKNVFRADDEERRPDLYALYLPDNLHYFTMRSEFAAHQQENAYYYWLSHMEKPNVHRVLAGLYLWKCKAQGIAPYCYQHLPGAGSSPFDDLAFKKTDAPEADNDKPLKELMTTYPAATGSIPTLQWKGLSAGITDLKYLATLTTALDAAENQENAGPELQPLTVEIRQHIAQFLARLSLNRIEIRSSTQSEPYLDIAPWEYQNFKEQMARDIVRLQNVLNSRQN